MPVKCVERDGVWRIVKTEDDTIEKNDSGAAVDGGGHDTLEECRDQAAAINANLSDNAASQTFFSFRAQVGQPRTERFQGQDHLVVPMVMLVEGVLQPMNAKEPELALAQEFAPTTPGWNGKPVVVNHPKRNGQLVSANSPDIWESEVVGQIFNTETEDKKLKAEAWIDVAKANRIGGKTKQTVDRLANGEMIEVSTGLFAAVDGRSGEFEGKSFGGIWRDILPDHLAILEEGATGACSIEDGCGAPRMNKEQKCACGPGCACQPQANEEVVESSENGPEPTNNSEQSSEEPDRPRMFTRTLNALSRLVGNRKMSDVDKRHAIETALQKKGIDGFVVAVFDDSFVAEEFRPDGIMHVRRSFDISDGVVNIGDDPTMVRPQTSFVPVKTNQEKEMSKEELVQSLINSQESPFTEDDRDALMVFGEDRLEAMKPQQPTNNEDNGDPSPEPNNDEDSNQSGHARDNQQVPQTPDFQTVLNSAPQEHREAILFGSEMFKQRKEEVVQTILGCKRNSFTEQQLRHKDFNELQAIANLVAEGSPDYSGRGSVRSFEANRSNESAPPQAPDLDDFFTSKTA